MVASGLLFRFYLHIYHAKLQCMHSRITTKTCCFDELFLALASQHCLMHGVGFGRRKKG
jgi:hypothetical protein